MDWRVFQMAKKKINSRVKGSEYERKIAKILGAWYEEEFHRVPASGGLRWGKDNRVAGDITTPVESKFPFTVECKKREEWDLEQILKGTGEIEKWWQQSVNDSDRVDTLPFLVFSKNFAPDYVMITACAFKKIVTASKKVPFNYFVVSTCDKPVRVVCLLEDFTKHFTKENIEEALPIKRP